MSKKTTRQSPKYSAGIEPPVEKNGWLALVLVLIFGPLGSLYVSLKFAAIFFGILLAVGLVTAALGELTAEVGVFVVWVFYIFYAATTVDKMNASELQRVKDEEQAIVDARELAERERQDSIDRAELEERRHQEIVAALKAGQTPTQ